MTGIIAVVVALPVVLLPAAFIWYLNIGGVYAAVKARRTAKAMVGTK